MKLIASLVLALVLSASFAQAQTTYCTAGVTSLSCAAQISANRQPDTANTAGCVITVTGVPGNRQGLVFYGIDNTGFTPTPWGPQSTSFRCVATPTVRFGAPQNSGGATGACNGTYVVNWDAFQNANPTALGNPWGVGEKVFAQSWYRDVQAPKASNLSNAVELTLMPPHPLVCGAAFPGMVAIPAGTFQMGSSAASGMPYFGDGLTQPVHQVTISYCFWMGATEVTQSQYSALMGANPSRYLGNGNRPVEQVSWSMARSYCTQLTLQQSALGNLPMGYEYRLPTEAEWEYACRAGTTTEFNVGASLSCGQANFAYSFHPGSSCFATSTAPVGGYAPNAWGLRDMHGNVWEWCLDSIASYSAGAVTDPFVTGTPDRVHRGGGFLVNSDDCRSASRAYHFAIDYTAHNIGFRVVLAPILVP